MKSFVIPILQEINQKFYSEFGKAFSATRGRIQPGIYRLLGSFPFGGHWLDLGCGNGALAVEWLRRGLGRYTGLDFSASLLEEARIKLQHFQAANPGRDCPVSFRQADLMDPRWPEPVAGQAVDGILSFAALHHIPAKENRLQILQSARRLLSRGGFFIHSEWQFQNSPRLMQRCLPWETAGLSAADLDEGDTLLDWRYALPGQQEETGLRYVHLFSRSELAQLAAQSGFEITQEFESDGKEGNLALYQVWTAV